MVCCLPALDCLGTPDVANQVWIEQGETEKLQCYGWWGPGVLITALKQKITFFKVQFLGEENFNSCRHKCKTWQIDVLSTALERTWPKGSVCVCVVYEQSQGRWLWRWGERGVKIRLYKVTGAIIHFNRPYRGTSHKSLPLTCTLAQKASQIYKPRHFPLTHVHC